MVKRLVEAAVETYGRIDVMLNNAGHRSALRSSHDILERKHMIGKIIFVIGILGVVLGGAILLISLLLPVLTDGRTGWDEALFGIIPGAVVLAGSFVIFTAGLIIVLVQRKKKKAVA